MSVPVLEAIADAIMKYEGWKPGSRSYRNRNPGNLRAGPGGTPQDAQGYMVYPTFVAGYQALLADLTRKVSGQNLHGLGPDSNLLDLFQVYAPSADGNDPIGYASFVAHWLAIVYGHPQLVDALTFRELYRFLRQELPSGVTAA